MFLIQATQVLFVSTQNFISISSSLGGCGCKKVDIPSKYIRSEYVQFKRRMDVFHCESWLVFSFRSYWVGSVSWSPGGLFLGCMLKRGSLLVLLRLGGLLSLTSSGCSVDFGPAHFLPLHPLVTYRFIFLLTHFNICFSYFIYKMDLKSKEVCFSAGRQCLHVKVKHLCRAPACRCATS